MTGERHAPRGISPFVCGALGPSATKLVDRLKPLVATAHECLMEPGVAILHSGAVQDRDPGGTAVIALTAGTGPLGVAGLPDYRTAALHWSASTGTAFLAAVETGLATWYWRRMGDSLVFATRLDPLRRLPPTPSPCLRGLLDGLVIDHPNPPDTLFEGLQQVPAGHVLRVDDGAATGLELVRPEEESTARAGAAERVREAVARAVGEGEPVTCLVSGGVDSAWLLALARRQGPVTAVTTSFGEALPQVDLAAGVAAALGVRQVNVPLAPRLVETWLRLVDETGVPQPDLGSAAVAEAVAQAAEAGGRVVLSGLGADELFGLPAMRTPTGRATRLLPPARYGERDARQHYGLLPPRWNEWWWRLRLRAELLAPELRAAERVATAALPASPVPPEALAEAAREHAAARFELGGGIAARLAPALAVAAAWRGTKVRCPFLDPRLLRLVRSLPPAALRGQGTKPLLRRAAARDLPEALVRQRKLNRLRPDALWLLGDPLPEAVQAAFGPRELSRTGWFDPVVLHHWLLLVRSEPATPLNRLRCRMLVTAAAVHRLCG